MKKLFANIKNGVRNYKTITANMSKKEKLEYLKDYYLKITLIIVAVIGCIVSIIITAAINLNTERIIYGVAVNVNLSNKGTRYVKEDFFELNKTGGRQDIDFSCVTITNSAESKEAEASYYASQRLIAQVSAKQVDYMLLDETAFQFGAAQEFYMDLNDFLSKEEFEKWKDKIVYVQEENSDIMYPTGIDITDTKFIKDNCKKSDKVFIAFAANAPNKEKAHEFFNYLLEYK